MSGLRIDGAVARPGAFDFAALSGLPDQVPDVGTVVPERHGGAVRLRALLAAAGADPAAQSVELTANDASFRQTAPLASLRDAVLVYRLSDGPLPAAFGGPVRFLVPAAPGLVGVDRCTNVKGLGCITVRKEPA